jgi:peptide/nickel transport system ATP-binding protein
MTGSEDVLSIRDLSVRFALFEGSSHVLNGVNLTVRRGERVALVGESACGKTLTARSVIGLADLRRAEVSGDVSVFGRNVLDFRDKDWRGIRGNRLTMIFQDPFAALNPVFSIADQLTTVILRGNRARRRAEAMPIARVALESVGIADPDRVLRSYPFQLSGGLNQRVMICMALVNRPDLVLADEPGTALDVTVQAQTLSLMRDLTEQSRTAVLLITHNLGVVREFAHRVYVMYAGSIVEEADVASLFAAPRHPYTKALLRSVPRLTGKDLPDGIPGNVPDYRDPPPGCRFAPRCAFATPTCRTRPPTIETARGHRVACVLYRPEAAA